jgi:hypothetical protein
VGVDQKISAKACSPHSVSPASTASLAGQVQTHPKGSGWKGLEYKTMSSVMEEEWTES